MNQTISSRDWIEYSLGSMKLIGFVEDEGDGIYEFNSLERHIEGRRSLMVSETDIRLLPLEMNRDDIESMIDLALQAGDKEWFNELSGKLKEMTMSFSEFLNRLDGDKIASDWDSVEKHKFNNG